MYDEGTGQEVFRKKFLQKIKTEKGFSTLASNYKIVGKERMNQ